jgi:hypothetical protein
VISLSGSSLDYLDLKHLETVSTQDGYQLEKYENTSRESYCLLLRGERFGPVLEEVTVGGEGDADQLLEASQETAVREVLEQ